MKNWLNKIERGLLLILPVIVFFSYFPVIRLDSNETMNLELSLPLIWLAIFGGLSILRWRRIRQKISRRILLAVAAFLIYATISVLWSSNPLRGILTAGILWLITLSVANICTMGLKKPQIYQLLRAHLYSGAVFALLCFVQDWLDVLGVSRDVTQLCAGCTYTSFGFSHANGFAIEPQFMGNLLILPCLLSLFFLNKDINSKKNKTKVWCGVLLSFWLIMSLYLCFSRGATYSFMLAVIYLLVVTCVKLRKFYTLWLIPLIIVAFSAALLIQGVFAAISPTSEGFSSGIARSINQMSLGIINLQTKETAKEENPSSFDGYVPESTNVRLSLNEAAIRAWQNSPMVGVGLGGAGAALAATEPSLSTKEIVQNEYLQILLELGVVGAVITVWLLIEILRSGKNRFIWQAVILAYLIGWGFFSGLPNALHIYLLTPVLYLFEQKKAIC